MMKTRRTGTLSPKKDTGGTMRRGVLALVVLLLACMLMAGAVSAEESGNVAKIGDTEYATLYDAFNATVAGQETVITLLRDATGGGAVLKSGNNTVLDLNGHTFTIGNPTVGSQGTETNGFQLLKDSDITIKNGKITSSAAKILIQNYANLTLDNVELDGSQLNTATPYTLSNNFGNIVLKGKTKITAKSGGVALDVYYWRTSTYQSGLSVTISDSSVSIEGKVTYMCGDAKSPYNPCKEGEVQSNHVDKAIFCIPVGYPLNDFETCENVSKIGYYWKELGSNSNLMQFTLGNPFGSGNLPSGLNGNLSVSADGTKATLLRDVTTTETITVDKKVTLDLNGHTITNTAKHALNVNGANADLTLVSNTAATVKGKNTGIDSVYGAVNVQQGKLTIGPNVKIEGSYAGVQVCGSDTDAASHSTVLIQKGATVQGKRYGVIVSGSNYKSNKGYGAVLDVSGTINGGAGDNSGGTVGIFISGYLTTTTGTNLPQVIIREGAVLTGAHGSKGDVGSDDAQAIAGNGYAKIIIYGGTFSGDEALGVKSGEWEIHGGTFTASGAYHDPAVTQGSGTDATGAAVSVTTTYTGPIFLTINGGTFTSTQGDALYLGKIANKEANVKLLKILGGTFTGASGKDGLKVVKDNNVDPFTNTAVKQITGGKYSTAPASAYLPAGYTSTRDGTYYVVAKVVPKPVATVEKSATGTVTKIDASAAVGTTIVAPTAQTGASSIELKLKAGGKETGDTIELTPVSGETLDVTEQGVVSGSIAAAVIKPQEIVNPNGQKTKLELTTTDIEKVFGGSYTLEITNEPKVSDMGSTTPENIVAGISVKLSGFDLRSAKLVFENINAGSKIPQLWHADAGTHSRVPSTYSGNQVTSTVSDFSSYYVTLTAAATSSGGGNMNNAFRVLFDTQGGSYVSPATSLSYGDKIIQPPAPTKDGYTFGGWYKNSACTQEWSFSDSIPGDMTLYAKWTSAAGTQAETTATTAATATATMKATTSPVSTQSQSTSATTTAPVSTTAAGSQPTLTQAPAPVFGALLGLLAAGVLLRRRD
ncbi:MAG TPA: InlB B-repeat-containing protein [Methanocorpusculum sp.]|nr:InlB B-repeat-containing protein [Methanocorpusculum sp.]HJK79474.1 InlB B-repeat-containing protein [Methanocorpusculum sp.]